MLLLENLYYKNKIQSFTVLAHKDSSPSLQLHFLHTDMFFSFLYCQKSNKTSKWKLEYSRGTAGHFGDGIGGGGDLIVHAQMASIIGNE